jgi:hypothetical protein
LAVTGNLTYIKFMPNPLNRYFATTHTSTEHNINGAESKTNILNWLILIFALSTRNSHETVF